MHCLHDLALRLQFGTGPLSQETFLSFAQSCQDHRYLAVHGRHGVVCQEVLHLSHQGATGLDVLVQDARTLKHANLHVGFGYRTAPVISDTCHNRWKTDHHAAPMMILHQLHCRRKKDNVWQLTKMKSQMHRWAVVMTQTRRSAFQPIVHGDEDCEYASRYYCEGILVRRLARMLVWQTLDEPKILMWSLALGCSPMSCM